MGENKIHLDMHVTVDGKMSVNEADELSEKIANKLRKRLPQIKHVVVHICPIMEGKENCILSSIFVLYYSKNAQQNLSL